MKSERVRGESNNFKVSGDYMAQNKEGMSTFVLNKVILPQLLNKAQDKQ